MSDRGPNQDFMHLRSSKELEVQDETYEDAAYLGTSEDDEEEVHDLGFIVDDHDDRRGTLHENWQRLDDLDTDEPLETNRSGPIPHAAALIERGPSREAFATDYHVEHAVAEAQEEDFVQTSMLDPDPVMNAGADDYTSETLESIDRELRATSIIGRVPGVGDGFGTNLPQDLGRGGFQIEDIPLEQADIGGVDRPDSYLDDVDAELEFRADKAAHDATEQAQDLISRARGSGGDEERR